MRGTLCLLLTASMGILVACSDRLPTAPDSGAGMALSELVRDAVVLPHSDKLAQPGAWGSETVGLAIDRRSARIDFLSSIFPGGGCFGAYGEIGRPIPNGPFSIAGTYTQLIGAFPGKVQYAAVYSGLVDGKRMSITIAVPALGQELGPFFLAYGVKNSWSPCLYP